MRLLLLCMGFLFVACTDILSDENSPAPSTITLPGLPHLEWMTENLQGFGGTEIDGRTYYTYDEAVAAVEQLGDGWRLPTRAEWEALCDLGSEWDDVRKGRWFDGGLFLEAAGYRARTSGTLVSVGILGNYSSSSYVPATTGPACLAFDSSEMYPLEKSSRVTGLSVRCVRDVEGVPRPELPRLEWMTENLSGFGGTEIDGRTYYTYEQAEEAVKALGDGWRLPTRADWEALCDLGSTWDATRKGRWFGGNHDTDHAGSLFLEAAGHCLSWEWGALSSVGTVGEYWSSTRSYLAKDCAACQYFSAELVDPMSNGGVTDAFSVRCVREML